MLSIILPSHREPEIHRFIQEVEDKLPSCEIIVSNDQYGKGKGWAIRQALEVARGNEIAFLDGDGDISPRMLLRLLPFLEDFDAVVGTKRIVHRHWSRRLVTILSRIYIRIVFGLACDTQTGIKLFRREMLETWKTDGFLFDVEILWKIQQNGGRIVEVPIEAEIREKVSRRVLCRTFIESVFLRYQLLSPRGR